MRRYINPARLHSTIAFSIPIERHEWLVAGPAAANFYNEPKEGRMRQPERLATES